MEPKLELSKFEIEDVSELTRIMKLNEEAAGRDKDWKSFIEWNISHPEDTYWKISLDGRLVGYIGYADATRKPTTRYHAKTGDLYLEIYLDPEFTGLGIGEESFKKSLEILKTTKKYKIYASTYTSNTRAQKFFQTKLDMKFVESNPRYNTSLYEITIN